MSEFSSCNRKTLHMNYDKLPVPGYCETEIRHSRSRRYKKPLIRRQERNYERPFASNRQRKLFSSILFLIDVIWNCHESVYPLYIQLHSKLNHHPVYFHVFVF